MPSELHRIDCPCRECRLPANRNSRTEALLSAACLVGLVAFSLAAIAVANFIAASVK
ncbi:hypothetical protein HGI47_18365 [Novosphingobium sp. ERN07]|uniref:hypothetical protein n=1 Tax=Novosphingobium sp. ERN07 TaxID=2726187 RepID=UPI001457440B|nr:hypothetical protein [Novosphingobium sp. ERN07]NLR72843.1 hypothetical protein [Novosphingobium sp. ERN07]